MNYKFSVQKNSSGMLTKFLTVKTILFIFIKEKSRFNKENIRSSI